MLNFFKTKPKEKCFALLNREAWGYNDSKYNSILNRGTSDDQRLKRQNIVPFSRTKEEAIANDAWQKMQQRFSLLKKLDPVVLELEVLQGTVEYPEKVKIIGVHNISMNELDPNYQEAPHESYIARTKEEMPDAKDGESEKEIEDNQESLGNLSTEAINRLSPDFVKRMVIKEFSDLEIESHDEVEFNGKKVVILGGTEIDAGKGLPTLYFVYNLGEILTSETGSLYWVRVYEKIDSNKISYAVYQDDSGNGYLMEVK